MCKKNLKKQNVVEELSWGGDFRKSTKTPNTEREEKIRKKRGRIK